MRLDPDWLLGQGDDADLLRAVDAVFSGGEHDKVAIAVSGGGDSMALLHLYMRWSAKTGFPILAATVNHGLRDEAAAEAEFVSKFCAANGIHHTILHWDGEKASGNIQAAARDARYRLLSDWAWDNGTDFIAVGHTANDVAETFLMRLARKSGLDGLAAMSDEFFRDRCLFMRPLWRQTREALRDYLLRHGVDWKEDPSNQDMTQTRPKARKVLEALTPLGIDVEGILTSATALASARQAIEYQCVVDARRIVETENGDVIIPLNPEPQVHPEIRRRLRLGAIRYINGANYTPRESAMKNLDNALMTQDRHTVGGCLVSTEQSAVRFTREAKAAQGALQWANRTISLFWDGRWVVTQDGGVITLGDLTVRALGESLKDVPDWRETGMPRASLMASPAVFDGETLISAPVAGLQNGFNARIVADFESFLLSR